MKLQSTNLNPKRKIMHQSTNSIEPDVVQQLIAEIGFSSLDQTTNAYWKNLKWNGKQGLPSFATIASSPVGFGQRIDGHKIGDSSFQQVTDRNGLSWWYDTSEDSDESMDL